MLIRDKIIENKELSEEIEQITRTRNIEDLLEEKKKTLIDKVESFLSSTLDNNEQQMLHESSDIIEILISHLRVLDIKEDKLIEMIERKNKMFGSYDKGYIKK